MLKDIIAFEWRTHTRQVSFIAACAFFLLFSAVLSLTGFGPANVHVNSPYSITQSLSFLSVLSVFVLAIFSANAIVRDRENRMEEIVFTTAMGKFDFLFGRFVGSFMAAVTAVAFSMVGLLAGALIRNNADGRLGPIRPLDYVWPFLILVVPSMLAIATVIFGVATRTRSVLASSVASVFIYVLYFVASALTNSPLMAASSASGSASGSVGALLDPFGLSAFFEQTRYWTPLQRDNQWIALSGTLLANRLICLGGAVGLWMLTYRWFSFRVLSGGQAPRLSATDEEKGQARAPVLHTVDTQPSRWLSFTSLAKIELRSLFRNVPFLLLLVVWAILAATEVHSGLEGEQNSMLLPATSILLEALQTPFRIIALITLIYFSTEVVWRERSARMADILNATPAASGVFVLTKWIAVAALLLSMALTGLLVALVVQLVSGGSPDLLLYAGFLWVHALPLMLFGALAVCIHVASRQKYAGLFFVMIFAVLLAGGESFGIPHHLLRFGSVPSTAWSDMNGFAPNVLSFHAYLVHWSILAALLLLFAAGLWRSPWRRAIARSTARGRAIAAILGAIALLTTGFIVYNTMILNRLESASDVALWRADYEKAYKRYESLAQPRIDHIESSVAFFPDERRVRLSGRYVVVNDTAKPVQRILLAVRREASNVKLELAGARVTHDARFNQYWLDLDRPLAPGERRDLAFDITYAQRGFEDGEPDYSVASNGSYLTSLRSMPTIGYRRSYEISSPGERRRYGLPPQNEIDPVHGEEQPDNWVTTDIILSTSADQTAVTTGKLVKEWSLGGRHYFQYKSDTPRPNVLSFASARYATERASYRGIPIELLYHPGHGRNTAEMLGAATASLELFEKSFGPYRYSQLKMAEVPSYWNFGAFATPDTLFFVEDRVFLTDTRDYTRVNLVFRRVAHEVAHQWWGHSVSPANIPGGSAIVETLTKYAEVIVLDKVFGKEMVRQLLDFELDRYLRGRADQRGEEPPLARVKNEQNIYYGKGAVITAAMRDLLGEQRMSAILSSFAASQSGPGKAATTNDLLNAFRGATSSEEQAIIDSWWNKVLLYDLTLRSIESHKRSDGRYDVTLKIAASRVEAAADGSEKAVPMREPLSISISYGAGKTLMLREPIVSGENEVRAVVDAAPLSAEIDPAITRIDRDRRDNVATLR